jgi:NAD(P)-dependent dehydrogenase (short-subunit alcohol dehydrogenase family)
MDGIKGAVAIVTGGGAGIGKAIVERLTGLGALVAVADIDESAALSVAGSAVASGGRAIACPHDVRSWDSAFSLVEKVEQELGPVQILVNNAGVSKRVPLLEMSEAEWDRVLDINLKGQFLMIRAVAPGMTERRFGRIVNLASVCGKQGFANFSHYCSSKFASLGLTQSLAAEFAPFDVTVNAVCPGIVRTPLHEGILAEMAKGNDTSVEQAWRDFVGMIPFKRPQEPSEIAEMVVYLSSDAARNMTGCSYHVDGGFVMS